MKRLNIQNSIVLVITIVVALLTSISARTQDLKPDFNSPAYTKVIDQMIEDFNGKMTKQEIIKSLSETFDTIKHKFFTTNAEPTFDISNVIQFVPFIGSTDEYVAYTMDYGDEYVTHSMVFSEEYLDGTDWIDSPTDATDYFYFDVFSNQNTSARTLKILATAIFSDLDDNSFEITDSIYIIQGPAPGDTYIFVTPDFTTISSDGGTTENFYVYHNGITNWAVDEDRPTWITNPTPTTDTYPDYVTFYIEEKQDSQYRQGVVSIYDPENPEIKDEILFLQEGSSDYIFASPSIVTIDAEGGSTQQIDILYNVNDWVYDQNDFDWITPYNEGEDQITFYVQENQDDVYREGSVTLQDNNNNNTSTTITVYQGAAAQPAIILNPQTLTMDYTGGWTQDIYIYKFNVGDLSISVLPEWISEYILEDDNIIFRLEQNDGETYRDATITFEEQDNPDVSTQLTIIQGAYSQSSILVTPEIRSYDHNAQLTEPPFHVIHFNIEDWEVEPSSHPSWIDGYETGFNGYHDFIRFYLLENDENSYREATITIQSTTEPYVSNQLTIIQGAYSEQTILVSPELKAVDHTSGSLEFDVFSFNVDYWEAIPGANWLPQYVNQNETGISTYYEENNTGSVREGIITVKSISNPEVYDIFTIIQGAEAVQTLLASPHLQAMSHEGGETDLFNILEYNLDEYFPWEVAVGGLPSWITEYTTDHETNTISFVVESNSDDSHREAGIEIIAYSENQQPAVLDSLFIIQGAISQPSLIVSPQKQAFSYNTQPTNPFYIIHFNIEDWEVDESTVADWVTIKDIGQDGDNDYIIFDLSKNEEDADRINIITIQSVDDPTVFDELTIIQGAFSESVIVITPQIQTYSFETVEETSPFNVINYNIDGWVPVIPIEDQDWVSVNTIADTENDEPNYITFTLEQSDEVTMRSSNITIQEVANPDVFDELVIYQGSQSEKSILITPEIHSYSFDALPETEPFYVIHFNIDGWEAVIADEDQSWVSQKTKVDDEDLNYVTFELTQNPDEELRDAIVIIQEINNPEVFHELTIIQGAQSEKSILVTPEFQSYSYNALGETDPFYVVHFNIEGWEVVITEEDQNWVSQKTKMDNEDPNYVTFELTQNPEESFRETTIIIQETDNPEVFHELTIIQGAQSEKSILVTPEFQSYSFDALDETEPFYVIHFNIEGWEAVITEEDQSWVTQKTKEDEEDPNYITFELTQNPEESIREATVIVQETGNPEVFHELTIIQGAQSEKSILVTPEFQSYPFEAVPETDPFYVIHFNIDDWLAVIDSDDQSWVTQKTKVNDEDPNYITFELTENEGESIRDATIRIEEVDNPDVFHELTIIQGAQAEKSIIVTPEIQSYSYHAVSETEPFYVIHFNIEGWEAIIEGEDQSWVSQKVKEDTEVPNYITFELQENNGSSYRDATIHIQEENNPDFFYDLIIYQGALSDPSILIYPEIQTVSHQQDDTDPFNIIHFNIEDWKIGSTLPLWLTVADSSHSGDGDDFITFNFHDNDSLFTRDTIVVIEDINDTSVDDTLFILQAAKPAPQILLYPRVRFIPSAGLDDISFYVTEANLENNWKVEEETIQDDWITLVKEEADSLVLNIAANTTTETRADTIWVSEVGNSSVRDFIIVYQYAAVKPTLIASPESHQFSSEGEENFVFDVLAENVFGWTVDNNSVPNWVTINISGENALGITVFPNNENGLRDTLLRIFDPNDPLDIADTISIFQFGKDDAYFLAEPLDQFVFAGGGNLLDTFEIATFKIDDEDWDYTQYDSTWVYFTREGNKLIGIADTNLPDILRTDTIRLFDKSGTANNLNLTVTQGTTSDPSLLINPKDKHNIPPEETKVLVHVFSNIDTYSINPQPGINWVKVDNDIGHKNDTIEITILENDSSYIGRSAYVSFDYQDINVRFNLTQASKTAEDMSISGIILDHETNTGIAGITVNVGPNEEITDGNGVFTGFVPISWVGNVTPVVNDYYFAPANWSPPGPVVKDILLEDGDIIFEAYKIDPKITINGSDSAIVHLCKGDILDSENPNTYPVINVSGTYQETEYLWEGVNGHTDSISNTTILNPNFFPDVKTTWKVTITNKIGSEGTVHTSSAFLTVIIKDKPTFKEFSGLSDVCKNQAGVVYTVKSSFDANEYFEWNLYDELNGTLLGPIKSNIAVIDWYYDPGNYKLTLNTFKDKCISDTTAELLIKVSNTEAPNTTTISIKKGDNMLVCNDKDSTAYYEWGYFELNNSILGEEVILEGKHDWYCRFPEGLHIDRNKFRYFVIKYDTYPQCGTRSFLDTPVGITDVVTDKIQVFPNPTENEINIRFNSGINGDNVEVIIYDLSGSIVFQDILNNPVKNETYTISEARKFLPGLYLVRIINSNNSYQSKIIVR